MNLKPDAIAQAALSLPEWAILYWPGVVGRKLRAAYWKRRLGAMGANCVIDVGVVLNNPSHIFLGDNVWLDNYVLLTAGAPSGHSQVTWKQNPAFKGKIGELHIGSNTHIGPFCVIQGHGGVSIGRDSGIAAHSTIYSLSHHHRMAGEQPVFNGRYEDVIKFSPMVPDKQQVLIGGPVVMEDATGVGLSSVLLPGATIRRFSWVGMQSVVTSEIPPGVIAAGNPAVVVKQRFGSPLPA